MPQDAHQLFFSDNFFDLLSGFEVFFFNDLHGHQSLVFESHQIDFREQARAQDLHLDIVLLNFPFGQILFGALEWSIKIDPFQDAPDVLRHFDAVLWKGLVIFLVPEFRVATTHL